MLSPEKRAAVEAEADRLGVDRVAAVAAAEKMAGASGDSDPTAKQAALVAERFLIGFMPYVTVREFRTRVLGLTNHVADEHLFTGEWLNIHGVATPATTGETGAADPNGRAEVTPTVKGEEQ